MTISTASAQPLTTPHETRTAAFVGIAGASITVLGGILVQSVVQPSTSVPDDMWSYPWSSSGLVRISLVWALAHALVLVGLIGFGRSGAAGPTRQARYGLLAAAAGTALLVVGELAGILVRHERTDDAGAIAVGAIFGLAIVVSAIGFLLLGRQTLRRSGWQGWRRYTPLATGIWCVALIGVNATKALPSGIAVYGLCLLALFAALYTEPVPGDARRMT